MRNFKTLRGWGGVVFYLFSLYEAICPGMVFCHQEDGTSEIEFALESSDCQCESCPFCRERRLLELIEPWCPLVKMKGTHCLHEDVCLENRLSDSLAAAKKFDLPPLTPPGRAVDIGLVAVDGRPSEAAPRPSGLPPPGAAVLRC